jgi:hypothetical protein
LGITNGALLKVERGDVMEEGAVKLDVANQQIIIE